MAKNINGLSLGMRQQNFRKNLMKNIKGNCHKQRGLGTDNAYRGNYKSAFHYVINT